MPENPKQPRRVHSDEFKRSAVELVTKKGYTIKQAADAVAVAPRSIRDWIKKFDASAIPASVGSSNDALIAENRRLKKALLQAEMERDILKKATAYFAKESK
ncbi:Transposase [Rosistilla oblonga]|uniref:transposase n=1 Tax=Rosistilla oblonga TaxID=2527990 RepID=UPI00118BBC7C|nr:transposase [Rosistilla oblonga]QDV10790.1 Transposase [Rosistilla oblonga]